MIQQYFKIAYRNLKRRQVRSWLTLLGIFISIAIIFILISLSLGLQGAVQEQFRQLGTDKFFIVPGSQIAAPGSDVGARLTTDEVDLIEKISGVNKVTYFTAGNAKVQFGKEIRYRTVYGIPSDGMDLFFESGAISIYDGQTLSKSDTNKILVGWDYKEARMFTQEVGVGDKIKINDVEFKTKGIMSKVGNPDDDKNTIMTADYFKEFFGTGNRVDYIIVQIKDGEDIKDVASTVERKLRTFRHVDENTQDFTILTPEELLGTFTSVLNIIMAFLIGIGSISVLVGGIGIATTMYTSVLERFREIGVMKAIGARNSDVLLIFLIEAGLLGALGGVIGVGLGYGVSKTIEIIGVNYLGTNLLKAAAPAYLIIGCIDFSFIIGIISGVFPALQASKIKPVDALRYE